MKSLKDVCCCGQLLRVCDFFLSCTKCIMFLHHFTICPMHQIGQQNLCTVQLMHCFGCVDWVLAKAAVHVLGPSTSTGCMAPVKSRMLNVNQAPCTTTSSNAVAITNLKCNS